MAPTPAFGTASGPGRMDRAGGGGTNAGALGQKVRLRGNGRPPAATTPGPWPAGLGWGTALLAPAASGFECDIKIEAALEGRKLGVP